MRTTFGLLPLQEVRAEEGDAGRLLRKAVHSRENYPELNSRKNCLTEIDFTRVLGIIFFIFFNKKYFFIFVL